MLHLRFNMLLRIVVFTLSLCNAANCQGDGVSTTMSHYDTIVVGCGAAGVTAATTLARAGRRVLALDAQDRVGGRVWTVPFGDGVVEVGAEWIHGTTPSRVYDLAIQHNVSIIPQELNFTVYRSDGSLADQELMTELTMYCLEVQESPPDSVEPLGEFITRKLKQYLKEKHPSVLEDKQFVDDFLRFINLFVNNYEASNDWNDVSAWSKYEDLGGEQHMSWHTNGYKTFFDILLNTYNNGPGLPTLDMKLNAEVTRITWPQAPSDNVTVECQNGQVYSADTVIITVSLGVLKERHTTLFSPKLPVQKQMSITNMSMGVVDKIMLSFPRTWWPRDRMFFAFVWSGTDLGDKEEEWETQMFGASCPTGSTNTLTLWTNGDIAKMLETLPEDVVKRKSMEVLRRFMGANVTIPEPAGMIRSQWYTNPFTRGSYTYDNLDVGKYPNAREHLASPLTDSAGRSRVLFAGEATNEVHFSTVHGASETGYREAMRLLPGNSKM